MAIANKRSGAPWATRQAGQVQHDTYGSIILAAMPMFFDRRLPRRATPGCFNLLETLGVEAARLAFEPEAGIGNTAAAPGCTPIRRRCAGPAAAGSAPSQRISRMDSVPRTGPA